MITDPNLITIGKFQHHADRLNVENWTNAKVRDAFLALQREAQELRDAQKMLRDRGTLTEAGIVEELKKRVVDRTLPTVALANDAASKGANERAAVRSSLLDRLARDRDPAKAGLRRELREFHRAAPIAQQFELQKQSVYRDAFLEQPPEISGLSREMFDKIESAYLDERFPGALATAEGVVFASDMLAQAANGLMAQLRDDKLIEASSRVF